MPSLTPARFFLALTCAVVLFCSPHAVHCQSGDGSNAPMLRVETGMHTAQVSGLAADPAGRWLVTGSDDKTVRVWDTATGRLFQTLRPPIAPGDEGKIYAVAVSPDGRTIACGGFTNAAGQGICLYLFDRASGRIRQRITGLANVALSLAYSPDGRFLAATQGRHGLSVFRAADGSPVAQDTQYADSCYGASFDKTGRLVTAALDGYIRLYDAQFKRTARRPAPDGRFPYSAAFSPDGTRIAVGYYDTTKISVLSATDLAAQTAPDTGGITNGNLTHVAWSRDGRFLYAAGQYQQGGRFLIRRWTDGGRGPFTDLTPGARNTIAALLPLPDGELAWSGTTPSWGVVAGTQPRLTQRSQAADFAGIGDAFRLSSDGATVQYRDAGQDGTPTRFSPAARVLSPPLPDDDALSPPLRKAPGLDITNWDNTPTPRLNGKSLTLTGHEASRSVAVAPGGSRLVLGTTEQVRCYDRTGSLLWHTPAPEITWAVNVAGNGQVCAAAFGDGTIHWYRMTDGKELLALFPDADRTRWLAWTPMGYYDCSPGGEDFVGWHINHGFDQAADFFPASRFRKVYYQPPLIAGALRADGSDPVASRPPIARILPPVVSILSPEDGAAFSTGRITLRYAVRTPSGEPASTVIALVDGRPAARQRDLRLVSSTADGSAPQQITLTVPARDCQISLVAENRYAPGEPAVIRLTWQGGASSQAVAKPRLYVLAIGISRYHDPSLKLQYGASDAQGFARSLLAQQGRLYQSVQEKVLTDGDATKAGILSGLQWVRAQTTGRDVAMIFLAGHGANDPASGGYVFIPADFDGTKGAQSGLPYTAIRDTVQAISGKALFFIDTCHSGNVLGTPRSALGASHSCRASSRATTVPDVTPVINELASAENGVVVFSASTGNQVSYEDAAWGHGAFTKALVEGLAGSADYTHTGRITVNMLDLYLSERVKALTQGQQTPTTTKPETVPDFPVAVLR